MSQIVTRWHRFVDAFKAGQVEIAVDPMTAMHVEPRHRDGIAHIQGVIERASDIPLFVMDERARTLCTTDAAYQSISDMYDCEVLALPYDACRIEYRVNSHTYFIVAQRNEYAEGTTDRWITAAFAFYDDDGEDRALVFPVYHIMGFSQHNGSLKFYRGASAYEECEAILEDIEPEKLQKLHEFLFHRTAIGLMGLLLLPSVTGIANDVVPAPVKLNKARAAKKRTAVPGYTALRLHAVENAVGVSRAVGDKESPTVHLRRAHKRRVAHGPGRSERSWRLIPATVVGYDPDGHKPTMQEVLASRAAKPYLVKA